MRIAVLLLLLAVSARAGIDPGCVVEYVAATGVTNWTERAVVEWDVARQYPGLDLTTDKIAVLKKWYTTNPTNVFPNMTAAQKAWLVTQWKVVRFLMRQAIQEAREE